MDELNSPNRSSPGTNKGRNMFRIVLIKLLRQTTINRIPAIQQSIDALPHNNNTSQLWVKIGIPDNNLWPFNSWRINSEFLPFHPKRQIPLPQSAIRIGWIVVHRTPPATKMFFSISISAAAEKPIGWDSITAISFLQSLKNLSFSLHSFKVWSRWISIS